TEKDKNDAIQRLIADSTPRDDFFLMIVLSIIMATLGLLIDNAAVVIGSMLIAPLLSPILSLSLGIVIADRHLMLRSLFTVIKSVVFAVPTALVVTLFFMYSAELGTELNREILARAEPSVVFAAIALVAGFAASFALIKPQLGAALPGIAVSVALIPPLAAVGVGLAMFDPVITVNSFVLFLINITCIILASILVFSLMNLYVKKTVAKKAIIKEDKKLAAEEKRAEQNNH
ncbi:MAG: TIGR00341 family protein, partial [Candidatus Uhrbacteria bacterium]